MKSFKVTLLHLTLIILLVLVVILIFDRNQPAQNPNQREDVAGNTVTTAEPFSEEGQAIKAKLTETEQTVGDLVMADFDDYKITYLIANDDFVVTVKKSPYKEAKIMSEAWFYSQGFRGFDVCHLEIDFVPGAGVEDWVSPDDQVFTGCPVALNVDDELEPTEEAELN